MALWMVRVRETGEIVWKREGPEPPELVVDASSTYPNLVAAYFPDMVFTWDSPCPLELVIVGGCGAMTAARLSHVGSKVDPVTQQPAPSFTGSLTITAPKLKLDAPNVRVVTDHAAEARQLLGDGGILGVTMSESFKGGSPNTPMLRLTDDVPTTVKDTLAQQPQKDSDEFLEVLGNFRANVLLARPDWADVLRSIPQQIEEHYDKSWTKAPKTVVAFQGRRYQGFSLVEHGEYTPPKVSKIKDPKSIAYLRWTGAYHQVEEALALKASNPRTPIMWEQVMKTAAELVYQAAMLYILENPAMATTPQGVAVMVVVAVIQELANFVADKDKEYGQPIRRQGISGIVTRLWDKVSRYTNLKTSTGPVKFESTLDSAKDMLGYSLILYGMLTEAQDMAKPKGTSRASAKA